jgi:tripartite-type tricarboxylate transporter receptor subunit TctC
MAAPDTHKALLDAGVEPSPSTPEEMTAYLGQELERWGKVVKETGVKLD